MKPTVKVIADQPSWVLAGKDVELAVTQLGGHLAPVKFYRASRRPIQPYYISPWQGEGLKIPDPVLVPLRGDFFCMPFGAASEYRGQSHHTHGEPATGRWQFVSAGRDGKASSLQLRLRTRKVPGRITKRLFLIDGENIVYDQHVLEGFSGSYSLGHHATLAMPEDHPGSVLVSTSPLRLAMTDPIPTGEPAEGRYQALATAKRFKSLSRVPLIWAEPRYGDCSAFPTRKGFTDLLGLVNKARPTPAWTTAVFTSEGFLWFSMKDPAVLPMTVFWMSNHGRHNPPWNGRNCCLGLEDVCGFFACGQAASARANLLTRRGVATTIRFSPKRPVTVNYLQGVVRVPKGFGRVRTVQLAPGRATFISTNGKKVSAPVRHEFLATGEL